MEMVKTITVSLVVKTKKRRNYWTISLLKVPSILMEYVRPPGGQIRLLNHAIANQIVDIAKNHKSKVIVCKPSTVRLEVRGQYKRNLNRFG